MKIAVPHRPSRLNKQMRCVQLTSESDEEFPNGSGSDPALPRQILQVHQAAKSLRVLRRSANASATRASDPVIEGLQW